MAKEIQIGNASAEPGEIKFGNLNGIQLRDSSRVEIPLIVVNGKNPGPALTVISTVHGVEIAGIEILRRVLREEIDCERLSGSVVAIPTANPLAFRGMSYVTPDYDFANLQGSFPGKEDSSTTSRIASQLSEVVLKGDYFVDLHCVPQFSTPWTIVNLGFGSPETRRKALAMGQSIGFSTIMEKIAFPPPGPETTLGFGMSNEIPTVILETNDWRHFAKPRVDMGVTGLLNVLKHLEMIEGKVEKQPPAAKAIGGLLEGITVTANHGGMVHMEKEPGDEVEKGELVARILDPYGDEVGKAKSPRDGYLIGYFLFYGQAVAEGEDVFYVASEFPEQEVKELLS